MEKMGVLAALLTFILALGANTTVTAQEQGQSKNKNDALAPIILLAPPIVAIDTELAGGCWARLFDGESYLGDVLSLAGRMDVPTARVGSSFESGRKYDSVIVRPKATLMVYDNEPYLNKAAAFKPGQRVPDLDEKLGYFETIRSLKLSCSTELGLSPPQRLSYPLSLPVLSGTDAEVAALAKSV